MKTKELVCLACDCSCNLILYFTESNLTSINGNKCNRGILYANKQYIIPSRTLTTILKVNNGNVKTVPVKSELSVPKSLILEILNELKDITVNAPINNGDIIRENICNTGINIIATSNVKLFS